MQASGRDRGASAQETAGMEKRMHAETARDAAATPSATCGPYAKLDACIPAVWLRAFNFTLISTAVVSVLYAIKQFSNIHEGGDPEIYREKMRVIGLAVSMAGILVWPVVFDSLVGYAIMTHQPLTVLGFTWPILMNLLDLGYIAAAQNATQVQKAFGVGEVSGDANTLVGTVFAIGSLLLSQRNSAVASATIPLLMYALLFLIAFIVPIPSLDPNQYGGFFAGVVQRTFFNYAMGFVITGLAMNLSGHSAPCLQSALQQICVRRQAEAV